MPSRISEYTSVDDVLSRVSSRVQRGARVETIPVEGAFRRVSSKEVRALQDVPKLPTSHMDGFAVMSHDMEGASTLHPATLRLVANAGPGTHPKHALARGETVQVSTGAVLPPGADAVVPKENAEVRGKEVIMRLSAVKGSHIYAAGEDFKKGDEVLATGRQIRAQDVGLLIGLGLTTVDVWSRPKVTVIATGSELTRSTGATSGKIRESHSHVFIRLLESLGCVAQDGGVVGDDSRALTKAVQTALMKSDFVITLGGTSAGGRDLIVEVVSRLHPSLLIHGIKLDRGRVTGVACVKGKAVLMMPGPIQAAMNAFLVVGTPLIDMLAGRRGQGMEFTCRLGKDWEARERFSGFTKVVYVKLKPGKETVAEPLLAETESMRLLANADGYFVVPEKVTRVAARSQVKVRLVPGFSDAL